MQVLRSTASGVLRGNEIRRAWTHEPVRVKVEDNSDSGMAANKCGQDALTASLSLHHVMVEQNGRGKRVQRKAKGHGRNQSTIRSWML